MERTLQLRLTFAALALLLLLGAAGAWVHAALLERRVERALEASALTRPADDAPTSAGLTRAAGQATTATLAAAAATSRTVALTSGTTVTTALPPTTATLAATIATTASAPTSASLARPEERDRRGGRRGGGRPGERAVASAEKKPPPPFPDSLTKLLAQKPVFGKKPTAGAQLQGVLGNQAMINGKWMSAGEQEGPVKVLEIGINKVVVEVDGNRQELTLWSDLPGVPGR